MWTVPRGASMHGALKKGVVPDCTCGSGGAPPPLGRQEEPKKSIFLPKKNIGQSSPGDRHSKCPKLYTTLFRV